MTLNVREDRKGSNRRRQIWLMSLGLFAVVVLCSSHLTTVEAFAAGKNKRKGRKSPGGAKGNGGFSGFGKPPPTLEDVLADIKTTRQPADALSLPCPCGINHNNDEESSPKTFAECCAPLLEESKSCQTPLEVLKSRYTSFCYRNVGHVIRTTHEECRDYREDKVAWAKDLNKEGMFDSFEFVGLEVLDDQDDNATETEADIENEAFLEFRVRLKGRSLEEAPLRSRSLSSIEGEETIVSERSRFLRNPESGEWKYAGGDVRSTVKGLEDTTLNA